MQIYSIKELPKSIFFHTTPIFDMEHSYLLALVIENMNYQHLERGE